MKKLTFNATFTDAIKDPNNGNYNLCYDNEECGIGEYCDIGKESNGNDNGIYDGLKYCFKSPGEQFFYQSPVPELCTNSSCDQGYCQTFNFTVQDSAELKGLCASHPICPHNFAGLNGGNECIDDSDCSQGKCIRSLHDDRKVCCAELYCHDGKTSVYNQEDYNAPGCDHNVSYSLDGKCCPYSLDFGPFIQTRNKCKYGILVIPEKTCSCQKADGNKGITQWCDDDSKLCCEIDRFEQYHKMYCPDARTPIYLQPKCNGTSCEKNGGTCVEGRCCPKLLYDEIERKYKGLPEKSFETEVECTAGNDTSIRWAYTFCHVVTNKLWILGKKDEYGAENVLVPTECKKIADCDELNNRQDQYCVMDSTGKSFCVQSPFIRKLEPGKASIFHFNLIVTVVFFIGLTIICIMMCVIMIKWIFERRRRMEQFH